MIPQDFKAPYLDKFEIRRRADEFRDKVWLSADLPIDIMDVVEFELDLERCMAAGSLMGFRTPSLRCSFLFQRSAMNISNSIRMIPGTTRNRSMGRTNSQTQPNAKSL